jgi:hypothetical protein
MRPPTNSMATLSLGWLETFILNTCAYRVSFHFNSVRVSPIASASRKIQSSRPNCRTNQLETAKIEWGTKSPKQMRSVTSLSYKISHRYHTEYESKGGDCLTSGHPEECNKRKGKRGKMVEE